MQGCKESSSIRLFEVIKINWNASSLSALIEWDNFHEPNVTIDLSIE